MLEIRKIRKCLQGVFNSTRSFLMFSWGSEKDTGLKWVKESKF